MHLRACNRGAGGLGKFLKRNLPPVGGRIENGAQAGPRNIVHAQSALAAKPHHQRRQQPSPFSKARHFDMLGQSMQAVAAHPQ